MIYPAEPWHLAGKLHGSVWLVPFDEYKPDLPPECTPFKFGENFVLLTAWVNYESPGILGYRELLCGAVVKTTRKLALHIHHIWVDNVVSQAGGRELWGIPKELAQFSDFQAFLGEELLAEARFDGTIPLPGWPTLRGSTAQLLDDKLKLTDMLASGRIHLAKAEWRIPDHGPLSFLCGRRPLLSLAMEPMRMCFGLAHTVV